MKHDEYPQMESERKRNFSFIRFIMVYLLVCLTLFASIALLFSSLIRKHDQNLTEEICSLVAEKMNNSIRYMTSSVDNMANTLNQIAPEDWQATYEQLAATAKHADYFSIGLVRADGTVYATAIEKEEFEKWGLVEVAQNASPVSISEPYRSGLSGQPVFTMFSSIVQEGQTVGSLFLTYPLEEIEKMANTQTLSEQTEIWLMDGLSDNIIRCSGADQYQIGSWNSIRFSKREIDPDDLPLFNEWLHMMHMGQPTGTVNYNLHKLSYTQVFARIDFMENWYVVVRLPSAALGKTMQRFRHILYVTLSILMISTLLLFILSHRKSTAEGQYLRRLSTIDPLTAVLNRRAFENVVNTFCMSTAAGGAVIFFDVDYFKTINDRFGHAAGDQILVEFAQTLQNTFPVGTAVSRFGGDEFVVLLRGRQDREQLNAEMEALRTKVGNIRTANMLHTEDNFRVHFSAGIAEFPQDGRDLQQLEHAADEALYRVKKSGRDGFAWAERTEQENDSRA